MTVPAATYWEKRCYINEVILSDVMMLLVTVLPHLQSDINALERNWERHLDNLSKEFKAADSAAPPKKYRIAVDPEAGKETWKRHLDRLEQLGCEAWKG